MKKIMDEIWVVSGLRTPFAKNDRELRNVDAVDMSVSVVNKMEETHKNPDYVVWGTVIPNLAYSNIARDIVLRSKVDDTTIAYTTTMACGSSLAAAIQSACLITEDEIAIAGGVESLSNVQIGLSSYTSKWLRAFGTTKGFFNKLKLIGGIFKYRLYIPPGVNSVTGKSMGQHAEITAQRLGIKREDQDKFALQSHQHYFEAFEKGFFKDLIFEAFGIKEDKIPRKTSTLEVLATLKPVFDKSSGKGSITAGNASLFTDGAAGAWIVGKNRIAEFASSYKAKMIDWEMAGVKIEEEGILMSPTFAIPRLLERNRLRYDDIDVWEIHEAFASQVLSTIRNLENKEHLKKVGTTFDFGEFPTEKLNPNGSSIAIGHPFGATGARILSQAVKEVSQMGQSKKALISVCADGGLGAVVLIET
ncbi:thiolase family protein [Echinicola soli]|uniref:Thiolase family protein n=1 Tax=Echinicola soli TaxID=2591634 RepID=A0A514CFF3_9BACT|nr:thiolase family protein [Echinicola soli]QDH78553.1 thiolase family protein [Echinicola soli]